MESLRLVRESSNPPLGTCLGFAVAEVAAGAELAPIRLTTGRERPPVVLEVDSVIAGAGLSHHRVRYSYGNGASLRLLTCNGYLLENSRG